MVSPTAKVMQPEQTATDSIGLFAAEGLLFLIRIRHVIDWDRNHERIWARYCIIFAQNENRVGMEIVGRGSLLSRNLFPGPRWTDTPSWMCLHRPRLAFQWQFAKTTKGNEEERRRRGGRQAAPLPHVISNCAIHCK